MNEHILKRLHIDMARITGQRCTARQLADLLRGYLAIRSMTQIMPWLDVDYGTTFDIAVRIRKLSVLMLNRLKQEGLDREQKACLLTELMEASWESNDDQQLQQALDMTYDLLHEDGKIISGDKLSPEMTRLLCSYYYHVLDEECLTVVQQQIERWAAAQDAGGAWGQLSVEEAICRLSVMNLFYAVTCDDRFGPCVSRGIAHYAVYFQDPSKLDNIPLHKIGAAFRELLTLIPYRKFHALFDRLAAWFESRVLPQIQTKNADIPMLCFCVMAFYMFEKLYNQVECETNDQLNTKRV